MLKLISTHELSTDEGLTAVFVTDQYIALGDTHGEVHLLAADGTFLRTIKDQEDTVWAITVFVDTVISGGTDGHVRVWDIKSGSNLYSLEGHPAHITALAVRGPELVVSGDYDGHARVWNLGTGEYLRSLVGHEDKITNLRFTGDLCVSSSYDTTVRVWNPDTGDCLHIMRGHSRSIFPLLVDHETAMTGSLDGTIRIWDLHAGSCLAVLQGHNGPVNNLRTYADKLVSCGVDGYVRIWSLSSYQQLRAIKVHDKAAVALEVCDGVVVTGGKEGGTPDDACGLDMRVAAWSLKLDEPDPQILQLGSVAIIIYFLRRSGQKLVVVCMKKGKGTIEIWE